MPRVCAIVLASLLALTVACRDKKKHAAQSKGPTPAAVEGLQAIPAQATAVIGIDVLALASSPVVERALDRMLARDPELRGELSAVLKACAIDPHKDVLSATIALVPRGEGTDSLLVTKGKYSEAAITACLGRFLAESGGHLESSQAEGRAIYHQVTPEGAGVWLAFGSTDTLLIASTRELLVMSLGTGEKLGSVKTGLAAYLPRLNTQHAMWAMGEVERAVAQGLVAASGGQVQPPLAIVGSADLGEGLALRLEVKMSSDQDAKTIISQAKMQIQAAALVLQVDAIGQLIKNIEFAQDESWARLDWRLSEQELADLVGANLSGLGSSIDKDGSNDENPPPESENAEIQGEQDHGNRNTDAGS